MKRLAVLAPVLVLLAGCTGAPAAMAPSTSVSASASPSVTTWDNAVAFSGYVLTHDFDKAEKYVSASSPAARYLIHQRASQEANDAAGADDGAIKPSDITYDQSAQLVTFKTGDASSTTWAKFEFDGAGLVTSWKMDDSSLSLSDRLWTQQSSQTSPYASIKLVSAYQNNSGLWIVLNLHAKSITVTEDNEATYVGADKRQRQAYTVVQPGDIKKGNSAYVVLEFEKAHLGGTLYYEIEDQDYDSHGTLKLAIK